MKKKNWYRLGEFTAPWRILLLSAKRRAVPEHLSARFYVFLSHENLRSESQTTGTMTWQQTRSQLFASSGLLFNSQLSLSWTANNQFNNQSKVVFTWKSVFDCLVTGIGRRFSQLENHKQLSTFSSTIHCRSINNNHHINFNKLFQFFFLKNAIQ